MTDIGQLNQRITIKRRQTGTDAAGQPLQGLEAVAEVWANVQGPTGLKVISSQEDGVTAAVKPYSMRIRFREDIDEGMVVEYRGQLFDITAVRQGFVDRQWTDLVVQVGGISG